MPREQETPEHRCSHTVGAVAIPIGTFSSDFADIVEEKTDGSVVIEAFPGGELGGTAESIEGVMQGTIDMTLNLHDTLLSNFGVIASDLYESNLASELNEQLIDEYELSIAVVYFPIVFT